MELLVIKFKNGSVKTKLVDLTTQQKKETKNNLLATQNSELIGSVSFMSISIKSLFFAAMTGPEELVKTAFEFVKELPLDMDEISESLDVLSDEFQEGDMDEIFHQAILLAIQDTIYAYLEDDEKVMSGINNLFKTPIYTKKFGMSYDLYGDGSLWIEQLKFDNLYKEITDYFLSKFSLQMQQYIENGYYDEDEDED